MGFQERDVRGALLVDPKPENPGDFWWWVPQAPADRGPCRISERTSPDRTRSAYLVGLFRKRAGLPPTAGERAGQWTRRELLRHWGTIPDAMKLEALSMATEDQLQVLGWDLPNPHDRILAITEARQRRERPPPCPPDTRARRSVAARWRRPNDQAEPASPIRRSRLTPSPSRGWRSRIGRRPPAPLKRARRGAEIPDPVTGSSLRLISRLEGRMIRVAKDGIQAIV
jgi:hypothetical protein